jgi:hypothetical protein
VRPGGVLQDAVPEPAHQVRKVAAATSQFTDSKFGGHRTIVFRKVGRKNSYRDLDKRHVTLWKLILVAVHVILETVLGVLVKNRI